MTPQLYHLGDHSRSKLQARLLSHMYDVCTYHISNLALRQISSWSSFRSWLNSIRAPILPYPLWAHCFIGDLSVDTKSALPRNASSSANVMLVDAVVQLAGPASAELINLPGLVRPSSAWDWGLLASCTPKCLITCQQTKQQSLQGSLWTCLAFFWDCHQCKQSILKRESCSRHDASGHLKSNYVFFGLRFEVGNNTLQNLQNTPNNIMTGVLVGCTMMRVQPMKGLRSVLLIETEFHSGQLDLLHCKWCC
jgi:hypothetical protein